MKTSIKIQKMTKADIEEVLQIQKSQNVKILNRSMLENDVDVSIAMYYVAKIGKKVVGFISAMYLTDHIDIEAIVVDKAYIRQHIASELLDYLIVLASSYKVQNIFLEVRVSNIPAISFYEKYNFKQISIRKKYYDNKEDAYVYELNIA